MLYNYNVQKDVVFRVMIMILYRGSSPNAHDGTWEKPCYAKSRCVRLLLCNECSTETPKPRKIEESVLDEVTTV